jgi:hypothetical protein
MVMGTSGSGMLIWVPMIVRAVNKAMRAMLNILSRFMYFLPRSGHVGKGAVHDPFGPDIDRHDIDRCEFFYLPTDPLLRFGQHALRFEP